MTEGDRRMITATLRFSYQVGDEDLALHIRDNPLKSRAGEILRGVLDLYQGKYSFRNSVEVFRLIHVKFSRFAAAFRPGRITQLGTLFSSARSAYFRSVLLFSSAGPTRARRLACPDFNVKMKPTWDKIR